MIDPQEAGPEIFAAAERLRSEHVISVAGVLELRGGEHVNPNLPTGEVELRTTSLTVLAEADTPPFPVDEDTPVSEEIRLRHRAVDLRRQGLREALILRSKLVNAMRSHLTDNGFLEIETPTLTRSTPEGARDFLVPSRNSPAASTRSRRAAQLFKQLLMMGGLERYYQVARCFRDEDLRADRQPEFTQLDIEMSFVSEDEVIGEIETLMTKVFEAGGLTVQPAPWPRLPYDESILKYGTDRPDLRYGLEIRDISEAIAGSDFKVFESVLAGGGVVRAINAGTREFPRKELDGLNELAQRPRRQGRRVGVRAGGRHLAQSDREVPRRGAHHQGERDPRRRAGQPAAVRRRRREEGRTGARCPARVPRQVLRVIPEGEHAITWVVDFPMFEWNEDESRWDALHHPFTAPTGDLDDPGSLQSRAYDLVLDGSEIGGGSIRIHDPEVQSKVLEISRDRRRGGAGSLRVPPRRAALRHAAARRHRLRHRPRRRDLRWQELDPRRDRLPEDGHRRRPAHGAPDAVPARQLKELGLQRPGL